MSWILPGDVGDALVQGGHKNLRIMRLPLAQLVGEGEGQDTLVVLGDVGSHAADAFKAVDNGSTQHRDGGADDVAAMLGVSRMPLGLKAGVSLAVTAENRADHYALIAVISTFV